MSPTVPSTRPSRVRYLLLVTMMGFALFASMLSTAPADAQEARQRELVVVGDSIVLGAKEEIVAGAPAIGWSAAVDAAVSRGTDTGLDVVRANRANITDVLVIGLGANDGGSPGIFRPRVEALLAEVANVPHVFWLEIAEVREYYPGANAVVREAAAAYPNVSVIPWSATALADPGLTADDGLHLTGRGQQAMADLVLAVVADTPTYAEADVEPSLVLSSPLFAVVELLRSKAAVLRSAAVRSFSY